MSHLIPRLMSRLLPDRGSGRVLVLCTAVASVGNGLYTTGGAVYFVHVVGLSPSQVGLGMSLAGILGLALGMPVGKLADRAGPRGTAAGFAFLKAAALATAAFVHSFAAYLVMAVLLGLAEQSGNVARGALVTGVMGREGRVRLSAYMRSVFNGGFALASLVAGLVIAADSTPVYLTLFFANAAFMVLVAVLYMRLPKVPGIPPAPRGERPRGVARDVPYLLVAQISGIVRIGPTALAVGVPLWLVVHTDAPRALAAWTMLVNTLLVVSLQVRMARDADTVRGAARLQKYTAVVLIAGCAVTAVTGSVPGWAAAALLVAASVLFTFGEIWGEAARWGLRYELAPANAQGQYLGAFATGDAFALVAGSALVTSVPDRFGGIGWLLIAVLFLGALAAGGPAIRWAERTRTPEGPTAGAPQTATL